MTITARSEKPPPLNLNPNRAPEGNLTPPPRSPTHVDSDDDEPPPYTPRAQAVSTQRPSRSLAEIRDTGAYSKLKSLLGSSPLSENRYHDIKRKRVRSTGRWIRDHAVFQDFVEGVRPLVWLSGNPGYGKTFVCGSVVSYLQGVKQPHEASIAYFFIRDTNPETRSLISALKAMALQVCNMDAAYATYLCDCSLTEVDLQSVSSVWRLLFAAYFLNTSRLPTPVILLLDGLDEAVEGERVEFLEQLRDLHSSNQQDLCAESPLRILMSGRPYISEEIDNALEHAVPTIRVNKKQNLHDIGAYLEAKVHKIASLRSLPPEKHQEIIATVQENADGMFLWCDLMMTRLSQVRRESDIPEVIQHAPQGLDNMLSHVLESISEGCKSEDEARDLNETLLWVSVCPNTVSLWDLNVVLASLHPKCEPPLDWERQLRTKYRCFFSVLGQRRRLRDPELSSDADDDRPDPTKPAEEKNLSDWRPNLYLANAHVTFCHAFVGQYFRTHEIKSSASHPGIGVDSTIAEAQGLIRATQIILQTVHKGLEVGWLNFQIVDTWKQLLLRTVDLLPTYGKQLKAEVGKNIALLLLDEAIITKRPPRFGDLPRSKPVVEALRLWFSEDDSRSQLTADELEWADAGILRPPTFFSKGKQVVARKWLKSAETKAVENLHSFRFVSAAGRLEAQGGAGPTSPVDWEDPAAVARSFNFEEDAMWHAAVASVYRYHRDEEPEKHHLEIALKLNEADLFTVYDLANLYENEQDLDKALSMRNKVLSLLLEQTQGLPLAQKVITLQPHFREISVADALTSLGKLHVKLGQDSAALDTFEEAMENAAKHHTCYAEYLMLLYKLDRVDEILACLEAADTRMIDMGRDEPEGERSLLSGLLADNAHNFGLFHIVVDVAQKQDRLAWLATVLQRTIHDSTQVWIRRGVPQLDFHLGRLHDQLGDSEAATAQFLHTLKEPGSLMSTLGPATLLEFSAWSLSRAFDAHAASNADDAEAAMRPVSDILVRLTPLAQDATSPPRAEANIGVPALFLARWHRRRTATAPPKDLLRPALRAALAPKTPNAGPITAPLSLQAALALILATAGGDANDARTAAVVRARVASLRNATDATPQGRLCDGNCMQRAAAIPEKTVLHACRFCDAWLCDECVARVHAGRAVRGGCRADHERVRVDGLAGVAVGVFRIGGRDVSADEFFAGIRADYGI